MPRVLGGTRGISWDELHGTLEKEASDAHGRKIKTSSYYSATSAQVYAGKTKQRTALSVVHLESGQG
jgi:hypothetical protein